MYDHNEFRAKALQNCIEKGIACPLAITPLADLACLGSSKLFPLFRITKDATKLPRELGLSYVDVIMGGMYKTADARNLNAFQTLFYQTSTA